jgi:hypothetical protein
MDEPDVAAVDASGRALIPKNLCEKADWITGTEDITVWLLMPSYGRCRVVSRKNADADADLAELIRKASRSSTPLPALEFDDEEDAVLGYRVLETTISHSLSNGRTAWRLRLPSVVLKLWRIHSPQNHVVVRFWHGHIEVWEPEALKLAHRCPLSEFL